MAQVSKLAEVLSGLVQNVDLTASDLVTNSVWVGGTGASPSVQVTPTLLNSYLVNPMTTAGDIIYENNTPATARLPIGSTGQVLTVVAGLPSWQPTASSGTVTSVSVVSANGLAGTVATSTTTPAITLSTTVTGVLQGNGTAISAATTTGSGSVVLATAPAVTGITTDTLAATGNISSSAGTVSGTNLTTGGHASADLALAGGTMSGNIAMGGNLVTGLGAPTANGQALRFDQLGAAASGSTPGIATLDTGGKVPVAQLPSTVMLYLGAWNASTNTPTLADGTGTNGDVYRASVAGTQNLGSGSQTWAVGDLVIYNGTIWQHCPAADGVSSVNGSTGAVTVNAINTLTGDVTTSTASQSQSEAATIAAIQGNTVSGTTGTGNVVFSAAPTLTGLLSGGSASFSSTIAASNFSGSSSGTNTGDQTITLTGDATGSGTGSFAVTVNNAPKLQTTQTAGTSFTTTTSYVVRWALTGETAGRIYIADAGSAASAGKYLGFGVMNHTGAVSAGNSVTVVTEGSYTLAASDSAFASGDIGKAVYLKDDASGGFTTTPVSTSGSGSYRIGIVQTTTSMWLGTYQLNGIA